MIRQSEAIQSQYIIQTHRLYMKPLSSESNDLESVSLYGNPEGTSFFENGPKTPEETAAYINEFAIEQFQKFPPFGIYEVFKKDDNTFIGHADLFTIDQENPGEDVEIGFILKPEFQGNGYGTEIALGLKDYIFDLYFENHPRVKRLVATAHPENIGSWKILEKIGMQFVAQTTKFNAPRKIYVLNLSKPQLNQSVQ